MSLWDIYLVHLRHLWVWEKWVFDMETDVLESVSAWLPVDFGCWSLVAAIWTKYWSTLCRMEVDRADGFEVGLQCIVIGFVRSWGGVTSWCRWSWNVTWECRTADYYVLFGVLECCGLRMWLGVVGFEMFLCGVFVQGLLLEGML